MLELNVSQAGVARVAVAGRSSLRMREISSLLGQRPKMNMFYPWACKMIVKSPPHLVANGVSPTGEMAAFLGISRTSPGWKYVITEGPRKGHIGTTTQATFCVNELWNGIEYLPLVVVILVVFTPWHVIVCVRWRGRRGGRTEVVEFHRVSVEAEKRGKGKKGKKKKKGGGSGGAGPSQEKEAPAEAAAAKPAPLDREGLLRLLAELHEDRIRFGITPETSAEAAGEASEEETAEAADNGCLAALLDRWESVASDDDGSACASRDVWGRTPLHWAVVNGHREAIVTLVEAGSDIALRDKQHESALDLAERRATCHALTVSLLKLMLPRDHADYSSFHPEGLMDLCTHEVLRHAERLKLGAEEREAFLALSPADHVMTIDELNARDEGRL
ncbi:hypothetical protein EMIHUDRAFT_230594 [Emiliania huxleyi CCMP1516]|uniref:Uncharacterized protein n=2 Tax=Emiliania huxleyi TaxID=2903 RepID=A0A0D3KA43_EMIH1|nr:hypothetical protein EMIHUDRAFT_230594 [Emiliania huxleyi CCMP1516]EOD32628.1 hypothetical protein EMIHUDRAFT_230594 [Emiliania huxleyi CCMP1516]|eukprot:XP_005785057.1 hypothetical protein EMIHUDRAFT_230594 [Emiliania huxleyi CCMP1516]